MWKYLFPIFLITSCDSLINPGEIISLLQNNGINLLDKSIKTEKESVTFNIKGLGDVIGTVEKSAPSRRNLYTFYGLPYAHDPSGENRFKEPKMFETPWSTPMDLQKGKSAFSCPHPPYALPFEYRGTEDCLKLFIYTPKLAGDEGFGSLPVMVWIPALDQWLHGGERLLDEADIVYVVVHFRLGLLGSLSTQTDDAPGNQALADQILALEYIQKYIHNFGGDSSKVVIGGESLGAASVSHLMLYQRSKGLFRGIISESGSALDYWVLDETPVEHTLYYGSLAGCNYSSSELEQLVECMRKVPLRRLMAAQEDGMWKYLSEDLKSGSGVTPSVQLAGKKIIDEKPEIKLRNGNFNPVPVLYGSNLNEGTMVLPILVSSYLRVHNLIKDSEFWKYDAVNLFLKYAEIFDDNGGVTQAFTEKYFSGVDMDSYGNCRPGAIDMIGVMSYKSGSHYTADFVQRAGAPAYSYSFEFDLFGNAAEYLGFNASTLIGVSHGLELLYLFPIIPLLHENMQTLSRKMIKLWTNFVIHLNPTPLEQQAELEEMGIPIWPSYSNNSKPYMRLDTEFSIEDDVTRTWMDMNQKNKK